MVKSQGFHWGYNLNFPTFREIPELLPSKLTAKAPETWWKLQVRNFQKYPKVYFSGANLLLVSGRVKQIQGKKQGVHHQEPRKESIPSSTCKLQSRTPCRDAESAIGLGGMASKITGELTDIANTAILKFCWGYPGIMTISTSKHQTSGAI